MVNQCITLGKVPLIFAGDFSLIENSSFSKKTKLIATPKKEVKRSFDYDDMKVNVETEVEAATNGNDFDCTISGTAFRQVAKWVRIHRYVKVKSDKMGVLLKIFLNKSTSDCFHNLSPIFTIFRILFNNDIDHI